MVRIVVKNVSNRKPLISRFCVLDIEMRDLDEQMPVQQPKNSENAIPSTKVATVEAAKRVSSFHKVSTKQSVFHVMFLSITFDATSNFSDSTNASQSS